MGLFAQLVEGAFAGARAPGSRTWRWATRGFVALLLPVHLLLAPLSFSPSIAVMSSLTAATDAAVRSLPADPALAVQELIVVNAPDYIYFVNPLLTLRQLAGLPLPRQVRALACGLSPVAVTRHDARSVDVRLDRGLFVGVFADFYRDPAHAARGRHSPVGPVAGRGVRSLRASRRRSNRPGRVGRRTARTARGMVRPRPRPHGPARRPGQPLGPAQPNYLAEEGEARVRAAVRFRLGLDPPRRGQGAARGAGRPTQARRHAPSPITARRVRCSRCPACR
jgi:hypothetical protein